MNLRQERQVHKIFLRALEKPAEDRLHFLERNYGHDPLLLELVLDRLNAVDALEGAFRELGADLDATGAQETLPPEAVQPSIKRIGSYNLVKKLGQGGMGTVYLADRADGEFNMRVAIKVTRQDLTSGEVVRRFKLERQIMATLQHPYIAGLHDGGTTKEGFPYFVMEYVDGEPIDQYCLNEALNLHQRLELFRKTCEGVAFAHRHGIVHRDIKPGNILVTKHGEPKLLDFGIASSETDPKFTATGGKLMTPAFASPEQIRGEDVGFASDVYSLGVLLYELITGKSPYQLKGISHFEMGKIICEEIPPPPSSLVTGVASENEAPHISEEPHSDLASLDQIVAKALRKKPDQRYESAAALVERLRLYQAGLPLIDPEEKHYDAYICAEKTHLPLARSIADFLKDRLEICFEQEDLGCEDLSRSQLATRLDDARCCLILVGSGSRHPWHKGILRQLLAVRTAVNSIKVLPLLLPGARRPQRETALPRFLRRISWPAMADEQDFQAVEQIAAMIEDRLEPTNHPVAAEDKCPFRGLESFQEEDQRFFFGRESLTQRLIQHLETQNFLAILGPSGSGKSSLMRAGLLPHLRQQDHAIVLFTPTARPLRELAFSVYRLFTAEGTDLPPERLARHFEKREDGLHKFLVEKDSDRLFIGVDQFEEIFTLSSDPLERDAFLNNLLFAVDHPQSRVTLILTLRSDFMGQCAAWPDLNCFLIENLVQVSPMGKAALRHAVEEPARLVGLHFEEGLVERLLSEVSGSPGELPLIQHALLELYKHRENGKLTAAAYTKIGGIEGALARRAETEFNALNPQEQDILRDMFVLCLVQPVEGADDAKRCATRTELLTMGGEPETVDRLLQRWTDARLLTVHRDAGQEADFVEVAHEALIRRWFRITQWMDEDRETSRIINRLRQESRAWDESNRSSDLLARGAHLFRLKGLLENTEIHLGPLEKAYIAAAGEIHDSQEQAKEKRRKWELETARTLAFRSRIIAVITLLGLLGLGIASWLLWRQQKEAQFLLADSYWRESQTAWKEGNPPLAVHLSGEALKHFPAASKEALLIHFQLMMEHGSWPLFNLHHQGYVAGAIFDNDEKRILSWSFDRSLQLWDAQTGQPLGDPMRHQDKVWGAIFNQADSRILSWGFDHQLRLWDALTNQPIGKPMLHDDNVWGAVFYGEDRFALSWSFDGTLRRWNLLTGQPVGAPLRHQKALIGALFNRDESRILSWSKDGTLRLWHTLEDQEIIPTMRHQDWVWGAAFSADETRILSWSKDGTLQLWDARSGAKVGEPMQHNGWVKGAHFFDQDQRIISWSDDASLRVWDGLNGRALGSPMKHEGKVVGASFNREGDHLLSWSDDFSLRLWNPHTGQLVLPPMLHKDKVLGASFSPDQRLILSWSLDQTLRLWDAATGQQVDSPLAPGDVILGATFNQQGSRILTWAYDKTVRLWATPDTRNTAIMTHQDQVMGTLYSRDEQRLLSYGSDRSIRLWDIETGKPLGPAMLHEDTVWGAVFSGDERQILSWGRDQTLRLWDTASFHQEGETMRHEGLVRGAVFDRDETTIMSWSNDQTIRFWDTQTTKAKRPPLQFSDIVRGARFDQKQQRILAWCNDGSVTLWNRETGETIIEPMRHEARVVGAVFSKDEARILSWGEDNTVRLWNTATGQATGPILRHEGIVWGATFFSDEQRILSWSYDKTLRIWDTSQGRQIGATMFHDDVVLGALLYADETRIISWSRDKTIRIWDIALGRQLGPPIMHEDPVTGAMLNQQENRLLSWAGNRIRTRSFGADFDMPQHLIDLQIKVTTGNEFDLHAWDLNPLSDASLGDLREAYLVRGLSHFVECRHRKHNLFSKRHLNSVDLARQTPRD